SPDLDDSHTVELLSSSGVSCPRMQDLVGLYLSYLVKAGFLATPPNAASAERQLPELNVEFRGLVSRTSHN
ncbi:hypothetical protein LPJ57_010723, partial [Coemansia sp. RSA 486]